MFFSNRWGQTQGRQIDGHHSKGQGIELEEEEALKSLSLMFIQVEDSGPGDMVQQLRALARGLGI